MRRRDLTVAVDARPLSRSGNGISRFVLELVRELERLPGIRLVLCSHRPLDGSCRFGRAETVIDHAWRKMPGTLWYLSRMNRIAREAGADVVWGTAHVLPVSRRPGLGYVLTVHDLVHEKFPGTMRPGNLWISRLFFSRSLANADLVAAVSETTRKDLARSFPSSSRKSRVVYPGKTWLAPDGEGSETAEARRPCLFCLGSLEPRKNIAGLLEVFSRLAPLLPELRLVIAGADAWGRAGMPGGRRGCGAEDRITFAGRLADAEIARAFREAAAFVFPSKYEGFGLPILEAEGSCPLVLADIPVFREIAQHLDDVVLVDFDRPEVAARILADRLRRRLPPTRLRKESAPLFDWRRSAERYADLFREAADARALADRAVAPLS